MSSSSTPAASSNPFMKRRRAYVACSNCRKRKVKCITVNEVDYRPCTRCAQKGLKCEYFNMPDDYQPSQPDTPSPEMHPPSHKNSGWSPQPITPPSAGLNPYLPAGSSSSSRGTRRGTVPPAGSSGLYPYRPIPGSSGAMPPAATPGGQWGQQQPPQQQSASGYPAAGYNPMQQYPGSAPQYYPGSAAYPSAPNAGNGSGSFYGGNYAQPYVPQNQSSSPWPQPIQCVCPPGPCYCGANLHN